MEKNKLYQRLGDYIQLVDCRNKDLKITNLRGVSTKKELIKSTANMSGVSVHNYKILRKRQFVYVSDTSRRGDKIAISLNNGEDCIVSSIYTTFEVNRKKLLPEYLFIWFNRSEFDRYTRFNSWGSARETFSWEDMCDIKIPIPTLAEQQKYVAIYQSILDQQKSYENSLTDLQLVCDSYLENLIKNEPKEMLGKYIEQSDERNADLEISFLQGVSTSKQLINTKANTTGVKFHNYKIVRIGNFVYVADTSRRGDKIALAMNNNNKDCIVSAIYTVFKVKDTTKLLPEYLYLFFQRSEFDRYARFNSWGSARETFDWDEMCNVKIPVPSIEKQQAIVNIYHALQARKAINEQLKESIKPLCPVLMRGVVG